MHTLRGLVPTRQNVRGQGQPAEGVSTEDSKRTTSAWRRALSLAGTMLLLVVAACVLVMATGRVRITPVLSGSMRPTANPGDSVVTERVASDSLHVGDVVVFTVSAQYGGGQKVHRIVSLRHVGQTVSITTKGDANKNVDAWQLTLPKTAYRVRAVVPYVGWIVDFKYHNGFLWLFGAALAVGLVSWLVRLDRVRRTRSGNPSHKRS